MPDYTGMVGVADGVRRAQHALVQDGWLPEYQVGEFYKGDRRCAFNWTMGAIQVSVWEPGDQARRWVLELGPGTEAAEIEMLATVLAGEYPPVGWKQHGRHP